MAKSYPHPHHQLRQTDHHLRGSGIVEETGKDQGHHESDQEAKKESAEDQNQKKRKYLKNQEVAHQENPARRRHINTGMSPPQAMSMSRQLSTRQCKPPARSPWSPSTLQQSARPAPTPASILLAAPSADKLAGYMLAVSPLA